MSSYRRHDKVPLSDVKGLTGMVRMGREAATQFTLLRPLHRSQDVRVIEVMWGWAMMQADLCAGQPLTASWQATGRTWCTTLSAVTWYGRRLLCSKRCVRATYPGASSEMTMLVVIVTSLRGWMSATAMLLLNPWYASPGGAGGSLSRRGSKDGRRRESLGRGT